MRTIQQKEMIKARAIKFIEDHAPDTEEEHKAGDWGEAFYAPVNFCDLLTGRMGAAWTLAKRHIKNINK